MSSFRSTENHLDFQISPPPEFETGISSPQIDSPHTLDSSLTPAKTADFEQWEPPELECSGKIRKCGKIILKLLSLIILLYIFICSLDLLSTSFRLLGGKTAGQVISKSELLHNPVVGLMIGILVTVLVQSSSTSTSIVVTMVSSELISVKQAIPIIMGANIGTSITNTIVSLMQISNREEFKRAFAAATVHDMFNWLSVFLLMPLEVTFNYLENITHYLVNSINLHAHEKGDMKFLKRFTKPLTSLIVQLDSKVITRIALGTASDDDNLLEFKSNSLINKIKLSDKASGLILLTCSLVILCTCLIFIVRLLHSMLKGRIALIIHKYVNAEFKLPWSLLVGYLAIIIGCIITILVQSSSIFTSALTPLAGIGVISLERVYPLTLGSNVGTTTTGILAALTADQRSIKNTLQLALCHLLFNVTGILVFYPIPYMRFPIKMAKTLGSTTAKYRWFSIFYLMVMFFIIPTVVFLISMAGKWIFFLVGGLFLITFVLIMIINVLQSKHPSWLPVGLQNWNWLPLWMHSLDPLDGLIMKLNEQFVCFNCFRSHSRHDSIVMGLQKNQSQLHILDTTKPSSGIENLSKCYDGVNFVNFNNATYTLVKTTAL